MSVIEFGCGGGNGLLNAEMHIGEIERLFPVKLELYGFDSGVGLPGSEDYRDLPHYFKSGQFPMDVVLLRSRLKVAKIVIGEVKNTCKDFFIRYDPAPVGCIFHDMDLYSSTRDAFSIFEEDDARFLPRIFMYFDDIIGDNIWLANEFVGEQLAIAEFNEQHVSKKIVCNRYMTQRYYDQPWTRQIYNYHNFGHADYTRFVADVEQMRHESDIKLGTR